MNTTERARHCNRDVGEDGVCNLEDGHLGEHRMRDLKQYLAEHRAADINGGHPMNVADTPIELPVTALGEVARLLREAQSKVVVVSSWHGDGPHCKVCTEMLLEGNDKLSQALILVDVERGDGQ